MAVLNFQDVSKTYITRKALNHVDLSVPEGSIVGLLGPNGSGKTTLIKLAAGLLKPTSGKIEVCGFKPGPYSKELVAYQADRVFLNDWMNINDLLNMMSDFFSNFNKEKALDMLESLNLNPSEKLKTLSKGNKEKVQLILTMSREVPLYLLDEPIGGVDPAARDYILNTILKNYKQNSTVILSTHLIADIEPVLNHIIFLKNGKIVRQGNAQEIRQQEGKTIDALFREEFRC